MTKHTPGPWYYVSGAAWTTPNGPDDDGHCVATRASVANLSPTEKDANLRLIASAPDLLAERDQLRALNAELVALWEHAIREFNRSGRVSGVTWIQAKAALAKAGEK